MYTGSVESALTQIENVMASRTVAEKGLRKNIIEQTIQVGTSSRNTETLVPVPTV